MMPEEYRTNPNQPINTLTVADLEAMVTAIVQKLLTSDAILRNTTVPNPNLVADNPPATFLETFGTWENAQSAEALIDDIYTSRTANRHESDQ
ncbi:MAG: hypothetical protein VKK04_23660 [Synechococcales bacterium]|nr:hypothetical protein [Synechococcales bacterium]